MRLLLSLLMILTLAACESGAPTDKTSKSADKTAPPPSVIVEPSTMAAQPTSNSPGEAMERFYEAYLEMPHAGLPNESERKKLEAIVTPALNDLIKAAISADAGRPAAKKFRGDPFSANPAGASAVDRGGSCNWGGGMDGGVCSPVLSNGAVTWKDQLLTAEAPDWRVSDIVFDGAGGAGFRTGKLSELLKAIAGN